MLDSPGEWYFSAASSTLYLWPGNSSKPASSVRYAALDKGIDLTKGKYVTIEGLRIEGVRLGIEMQDGRGILLRDLDIAIRRTKASAALV